MTSEQFQNLRAGDVINRKDTGEGYIVVGDVYGMLQAVRVIGLKDPDFWKIGKAGRSNNVYSE